MFPRAKSLLLDLSKMVSATRRATAFASHHQGTVAIHQRCAASKEEYASTAVKRLLLVLKTKDGVTRRKDVSAMHPEHALLTQNAQK